MLSTFVISLHLPPQRWKRKTKHALCPPPPTPPSVCHAAPALLVLSLSVHLCRGWNKNLKNKIPMIHWSEWEFQLNPHWPLGVCVLRIWRILDNVFSALRRHLSIYFGHARVWRMCMCGPVREVRGQSLSILSFEIILHQTWSSPVWWLRPPCLDSKSRGCTCLCLDTTHPLMLESLMHSTACGTRDLEATGAWLTSASAPNILSTS